MSLDCLNSLAAVATLVSLIVTLGTLACSAAWWIRLQRKQQEDIDYRRFFDLMLQFGDEAPLSSKMAAAYQLRQYQQYADVIIRFCDGKPVKGDAAELLAQELEKTADYLKRIKGLI